MSDGEPTICTPLLGCQQLHAGPSHEWTEPISTAWVSPDPEVRRALRAMEADMIKALATPIIERLRQMTKSPSHKLP